MEDTIKQEDILIGAEESLTKEERVIETHTISVKHEKDTVKQEHVSVQQERIIKKEDPMEEEQRTYQQPNTAKTSRFSNWTLRRAA